MTLIFFFFHKNYYQKHFLIFRCREVFKTVLDNQKKPVSITGEYFQEHNSSPRVKRILKTDSLRVCCLECLMLKKRTVSACTLGMHYVVDNHEHSFVCFLRKIWSKKKRRKTETRLGGPQKSFIRGGYAPLRLEVRPLTSLYIPFLTEKVPLSYT